MVSVLKVKSQHNRKCTQLAALPCSAVTVVYNSFNSISLKLNDISLHHIRVLQLTRTKEVFIYIFVANFIFSFHKVSMIRQARKRKRHPRRFNLNG